jgi:triacylglycerol lipase
MRMRPAPRLAGLSPRRRALITVVALVVVALAVAGGIGLSHSGSAAAPQDPSASRPGYVLLVPGYGGSTSALVQLAARIRATGRTATVVPLAGDGTGDLHVQARVLNGYVNQALRDGSGPVTVIGYSAGGVVAWLWDVEDQGAGRVGRIITLGSPLHGASLAALGAAFVPGECPAACQQLVPGSALLSALQSASPAARPPWLSLWTTDDQVVQPPDSARLTGAVNVPLQSVCPGVNIQHGGLPTSALVVGIVLRSLGSKTLAAPVPAQCQALQSLGRG